MVDTETKSHVHYRSFSFSSSHCKLICSRHEIAETLLSWHLTTTTITIKKSL